DGDGGREQTVAEDEAHREAGPGRLIKDGDMADQTGPKPADARRHDDAEERGRLEVPPDVGGREVAGHKQLEREVEDVGGAEPDEQQRCATGQPTQREVPGRPAHRGAPRRLLRRPHSSGPPRATDDPSPPTVVNDHLAASVSAAGMGSAPYRPPRPN